ncbi:hypothetical protein JM654_12045 [Microbacterium oxydans]|nr:hypothetical protein [Microbacterium oxydans]
MALSLDEFRTSLQDPGARPGLGLPLTDAEAQQVAADAQATLSWYEYWLAVTAQAAPLGTHDLVHAAAFAAAPRPMAALRLPRDRMSRQASGRRRRAGSGSG